MALEDLAKDLVLPGTAVAIAAFAVLVVAGSIARTRHAARVRGFARWRPACVVLLAAGASCAVASYGLHRRLHDARIAELREHQRVEVLALVSTLETRLANLAAIEADARVRPRVWATDLRPETTPQPLEVRFAAAMDERQKDRPTIAGCETPPDLAKPHRELGRLQGCATPLSIAIVRVDPRNHGDALVYDLRDGRYLGGMPLQGGRTCPVPCSRDELADTVRWAASPEQVLERASR